MPEHRERRNSARILIKPHGKQSSSGLPADSHSLLTQNNKKKGIGGPLRSNGENEPPNGF
jgi:hypothetical protein